MNMHHRLNRLEQAAGINVPCAVCVEIDGFSEVMKNMIAPYIDESVQTYPFSYRSFCAYCGRAEIKKAAALDAEGATGQTFVLAALDEGRMCAPDVATVARECLERSEAAMRKLLGDGWPEFQSRYAEHQKRLAVLRQTHATRFPYVYAVEGCACEDSKTKEEVLH